jgi:sterol desaturase/sphingolipid hydroxylase (fatty acid hydroxylase superfamily)
MSGGMTLLDVSVLRALLPLSVLVWAGHMVVFHGAGLAFELCDRKGWLRRYKLRDRERFAYLDFLPRVLFNQTFLLLPAMWLCEKLGLAFSGPKHITLIGAVLSILLMTIGHDLVQYFSHRFLLHNSRFRFLGHALHHSTGASKSITACYMSGPDFFLTIVCPYLVPLVLIGGGTADFGFQLLVAALGAIGGLYEHSGYDFARGIRSSAANDGASLLRLVPDSLISSHAHGEHHRRSRVSFSDGFGSPGLCDAIFRTRWDLR